MNCVQTVSVIIPLYNKAAYAERAVRSALAQHPEPLEVLVIDDGSTDDGVARLERMAEHSRIRIVRQNNAGEGAARNRGLREMRGQLAAFLDADDQWLPGHLQNLLELAQDFPNAGLLATGFRTAYAKGVLVETRLSGGGPVLISNYFETARGGYRIHISSCAVRKSVAEEVGGFVEGESFGVDLDFYARVALRYPVAVHPAVSGLYYANVSGSVINGQKWNHRYPAVVRLLRSARPIRAELARSAEDYADWILAEYALTGLCAGNRRDAVSLFHQIRSRWWVPFRSPGLVRLGAEWLPLPLVRTLVRFRRSRFGISGAWRQPHMIVSRVLRADAQKG
jgi:glycosyltransferase involved in cell wall biosynthesis